MGIPGTSTPGRVASRHMSPTSGGFILKLGSDGSYRWVQTFGGGVKDGGSIISVAGTPDGGAVGIGVLPEGAGVMKLNA